MLQYIGIDIIINNLEFIIYVWKFSEAAANNNQSIRAEIIKLSAIAELINTV